MNITRQHKDRLFRAIFGSSERKEYALALYNAINGTEYTNAEDLQIYNIEDAVYMGMKNDVSFLFADMLNLYEEQSTLNPNMPLRGFLYLSKQYEKYIEEHKLNLYRTTLRKIPTPQYYVFYNGSQNAPERTVLRLSDAFLTPSSGPPCLEVLATVLNINYGQNRDLLARCKPLADYSKFVNCVRIKQEEGLELPAAVDAAIGEAIEADLLDGYFRMHKAEVVGMVLAEYDEEQTKKDWYEDGKAEGVQIGRAGLLADLINSGILSAMEAQKISAIKAETASMVLAEYDEEQTKKDWYEDGKAEGLQEGEKKGIQKGRTEGRKELLADLIKSGILSETEAQQFL